jgi:hypothetical protein
MKAPVTVAAMPDRNTAVRVTGASNLAVATGWGTGDRHSVCMRIAVHAFAMDQLANDAMLTNVLVLRLHKGGRTA